MWSYHLQGGVASVLMVGLVAAVALPGASISGQDTGHRPTCPFASHAGLSTGPHNVVLNEVRFWYRVAGQSKTCAPPVIFLHGGPGYNSYSFSALIGPRLESALRIIYFDERGSGRSERPWNGHYQLDTLVNDIEALRRELGLQTVALIGHSFGGTLALEYAARYPEHVARMVLVSGFWDHTATCSQLRGRAMAAYPDAFAKLGADTLGKGGAPLGDCDLLGHALSQEQFNTLNNAGQFVDSLVRLKQDSVDAASGLSNTGELGHALEEAGLYDRYRFSRFAGLTMPVLVIAGRHDGAVGFASQQELARALPQGKLSVYDQSAHFPYLEEPKKFADEVTAFLSAQ